MVVIEVARINTYYGKSHVIKDVSLIVKEREIVTLIGRNGAGKTTTLRSIIGLTPPKTGNIRYFGKTISGCQPFRLVRMGMGFVFEDRRIFPDLTVRDNLEISSIRHSNRETKWTTDKIFDTFPILKSLEKRKGMNLSGGEQQILAITRALMGNPECLLLDEPTEGLAPIIVKSLGHLLEEIRTEITILLSEQNVRFAMDFADRGYIIDKGRIRFGGSKEELRSNKEVQERFLGI